jgi:ferredoxin-NADP reductase
LHSSDAGLRQAPSADAPTGTAEAAPVLLISGRDGLEPIMSLLGTLCGDADVGPVGLVHYDDRPVSVHRRARLDALTCRCRKVQVLRPDRYQIAQPESFRADDLEAFGPWQSDAEAFVCGPPELEAAVREHFAASGRSDQLHTDVFRLIDSTSTGSVCFARSGIEAAHGGTVLERAEASGLRVPYGCRVGVCDTCLQVKVRGRTRDLRTGEIDDEQDVEINICVSVPEGEVVMDL